jgi:hypothetical protein
MAQKEYNGYMKLENEVINLTGKWMKYVSLDHHKDRDCHWYITKTYSYGEEPYYEAHHSGYILDHWISPRCGSEEMALTILRDKLKIELKEAVIHLKEILHNEDALDWVAEPKEKIQELIDYLQ